MSQCVSLRFVVVRDEWSSEDLVGSWTLVDEDWRLVGNKSGPTRLGFALLLKFFEIEARFPAGSGELPSAAVAYVADQVGVDPGLIAEYPWSGRTIKYHRAQIRKVFGFREFTRADEDKFADWLATEVCPVELRDEQLHEAVLVRCRAVQVEPPGRPGRIIAAAKALFEKTFCEQTVLRLGEACAERLEALVEPGDGKDGLLAELKVDPGQVSLDTLLREIGKLGAVKGLKLPAGLFADCSERLVEAWRARATRSYPSDLAAAAGPVRLTLLAAVLDAAGRDHRRAGGLAVGAGVEDQHSCGQEGRAGADRGSAPGARQGWDPVPSRAGRCRPS